MKIIEDNTRTGLDPNSNKIREIVEWALDEISCIDVVKQKHDDIGNLSRRHGFHIDCNIADNTQGYPSGTTVYYLQVQSTQGATYANVRYPDNLSNNDLDLLKEAIMSSMKERQAKMIVDD